jgi:hypothetical protein
VFQKGITVKLWVLRKGVTVLTALLKVSKKITHIAVNIINISLVDIELDSAGDKN